MKCPPIVTSNCVINRVSCMSATTAKIAAATRKAVDWEFIVWFPFVGLAPSRPFYSVPGTCDN